MPGGRVEPSESPRAAASRELLEETGINVPSGVLIAAAAHTVVTSGLARGAGVSATRRSLIGLRDWSVKMAYRSSGGISGTAGQACTRPTAPA